MSDLLMPIALFMSVFAVTLSICVYIGLKMIDKMK